METNQSNVAVAAKKSASVAAVGYAVGFSDACV